MNLSKNKSYKQTINRKPNSTKPKKGSNIHEHIPYEHINRTNLSQHYYTEQCYLNFQNHQTTSTKYSTLWNPYPRKAVHFLIPWWQSNQWVIFHNVILLPKTLDLYTKKNLHLWLSRTHVISWRKVHKRLGW